MSTAGIVGLALAGVVAAASATSAHHAAGSLGRVHIPEPVMVGGQLVQPGTYDLRLTGEHLKPLPGQSEDAGQHRARCQWPDGCARVRGGDACTGHSGRLERYLIRLAVAR